MADEAAQAVPFQARGTGVLVRLDEYQPSQALVTPDNVGVPNHLVPGTVLSVGWGDYSESLGERAMRGLEPGVRVLVQAIEGRHVKGNDKYLRLYDQKQIGLIVKATG